MRNPVIKIHAHSHKIQIQDHLGHPFSHSILKSPKLESKSIDHPITSCCATSAISHGINSAIPRKKSSKSRAYLAPNWKCSRPCDCDASRNGRSTADIWTYSILIAFQKNGHRIKVAIKRSPVRDDRPHLLSRFYLRPDFKGGLLSEHNHVWVWSF